MTFALLEKSSQHMLRPLTCLYIRNGNTVCEHHGIKKMKTKFIDHSHQKHSCSPQFVGGLVEHSMELILAILMLLIAQTKLWWMEMERRNEDMLSVHFRVMVAAFTKRVLADLFKGC